MRCSQSFCVFIVLVVLSTANVLTTNASGFSRDSLDNLMTNGLYSEAETYFLTSKNAAFESNDSTKIEWLIKYSSIAASATHSDLAFENIQQAIQLAEETESVYLISQIPI